MIKYYIMLLFMGFFNSLGAIFLKKSTGVDSIKSLIRSSALYIGTFFYLIGGTLNIIVMRNLKYSVVLPMTSITFVWTLVLSYLILKEKLTKLKTMGLLIVILGAVFVAY